MKVKANIEIEHADRAQVEKFTRGIKRKAEALGAEVAYAYQRQDDGNYSMLLDITTKGSLTPTASIES